MSQPVPEVRLVAVIDLAGTDYWDRRQVLDDLYQQARFVPDAAHVRVKLGQSAVTAAGLQLEQEIGRAFCMAASIDVEIPGGSRWARHVISGIVRHAHLARQLTTEHLNASAS